MTLPNPNNCSKVLPINTKTFCPLNNSQLIKFQTMSSWGNTLKPYPDHSSTSLKRSHAL
jgi:hypothetical protein